jgi:hypothetical protein
MAVMLLTAAAHAAGVGGSHPADPDSGDPAPPVGRVCAVVLAVGVGLLLGRRGRSMPVVVLISLLAYVGAIAASFAVVALLG